MIIGSGLGGLSCGYILQRNGFDVTIYEKNPVLGGCLQCFRRKGAVFETGMHFIGSAAPGQTMDRMMQYMGIASDVRLSRLSTLILITPARRITAAVRAIFLQILKKGYVQNSNYTV